jgi:hypothetical protein
MPRISSRAKAERLAFVIDELRRGVLHKHQIMAAFAEKFDSTPKTAQKYLTPAREALCKEYTGQSREEQRAVAAEWLISVVNDRTALLKDRLIARKHLTELFGLDAPRMVHQEIKGKLETTIVDLLNSPAVLALAEEHNRIKGTESSPTNGTGNGNGAALLHGASEGPPPPA